MILRWVCENGVMRDDFEVGVFDVEVVEKWCNESEVAEGGGGVRINVGRFEKCVVSMREYIPCLDNVGAGKNGEKFEWHCPEKDKGLDCLVPTPKGYKAAIPWARSRDEMIPAIAFGRQTRVVLDVGCGVASFGAYLASRNVLTMSVAQKDVHENQIQFALKRGVPAMLETFATRRLLYPSQDFDLIHCSRCKVNWTRDGIQKEVAKEEDAATKKS